MDCYNKIYLIITALGVLANFIIGIRANKISKTIEDNNRREEQISKRPAPIVDHIFVKKSSYKEDYDSHMRLFYGDIDSDELSLENQVYVKSLENNDNDDASLIAECINNKGKAYLTHYHGNLCFVINNLRSNRYFIFEYCSTKIILRNYKNIINSVKINYLKVISHNGKENVIKGADSEKFIVISENGCINIMMCFVANKPEETLCINKPEEYRKLPDIQSDVLREVVNEPMLKYKKLIFNCCFKTIDGFSYTYEITINTTNVGLETWTKFISEK